MPTQSVPQHGVACPVRSAGAVAEDVALDRLQRFAGVACLDGRSVFLRVRETACGGTNRTSTVSASSSAYPLDRERLDDEVRERGLETFDPVACLGGGPSRVAQLPPPTGLRSPGA